MLILRRRVGEAILIGDSIEIQITEISSTKVKIAVLAPSDVQVQRKEMALAREQNRRAATLSIQARDLLAQNLSRFFAKTLPEVSDMNFEARYSGHPKKKENLEPA